MGGGRVFRFHVLSFHEFSYFVINQSHTFVLIIRLSFLHALCCLCFTPSNKSNRNNSFKFIFIKIIITEVNIIKIYSNKAHTITKGCKNIRVYIIKVYIIIREYNLIKFFKSFICNKSMRNNFKC